MDIKQMIETDPDGLVTVIERELGSKFSRISDEDKKQTFWLGVVKAFDRVDHQRDALQFLILAGWNEVANYKRSVWSRENIRYCNVCNKYHGYRVKYCPTCGQEMLIAKRFKSITDNYRYKENWDHSIHLQMFVETLSGKIRYIAQRWLLDRVDLLFENHSKQLAFELNISAPMVSKYKNRIRKLYKEWSEK